MSWSNQRRILRHGSSSSLHPLSPFEPRDVRPCSITRALSANQPTPILLAASKAHGRSEYVLNASGTRTANQGRFPDTRPALERPALESSSTSDPPGQHSQPSRRRRHVGGTIFRIVHRASDPSESVPLLDQMASSEARRMASARTSRRKRSHQVGASSDSSCSSASPPERLSIRASAESRLWAASTRSAIDAQHVQGRVMYLVASGRAVVPRRIRDPDLKAVLSKTLRQTVNRRGILTPLGG